MDKKSWEKFVKGDLLAVFQDKELQSISISDGGNKAKIKRSKDNDYKVEISSVENM